MFIAVAVLIIIICVILALIVLIQNPKGGGVNASMSGVSNQIFGASKSTDFVEKATWSLAIALMVLCLVSFSIIDKTPTVANQEGKNNATTAPAKFEKSEVEEQLKNNPNTVTAPAPAAVTPAPVTPPAPAAPAQ